MTAVRRANAVDTLKGGKGHAYSVVPFMTLKFLLRDSRGPVP